MIKCNICKDLMPNYMEKLTSEETASDMQEHIETCKSCKKLHDNLANPQPEKTLAAEIDGENEKEIDHLRTIKRKTFKKSTLAKIGAAFLSVALVSLLFYQLFFHGSMVQSDSITVEPLTVTLVSTSVQRGILYFTFNPDQDILLEEGGEEGEGGIRFGIFSADAPYEYSLQYAINFSLENGNALRVKDEYVYDTEGVLKQVILTPYEYFPLFTKTSSHIFGHIPSLIEGIATSEYLVEIVVKLKDKDLLFYYLSLEEFDIIAFTP